jgi:hypothetical protein
VDELRGQLRRVQQAAESANRQAALKQVSRDLHAVRKHLGRLKADWDAADRTAREARRGATLLQQELANLLRSEAARFAKPPGILEDLLRRAQNAGGVLDQMEDERAFRDALRELNDIRKGMQAAASEAASNVADELRGQLAQLDHNLSGKFDSSGMRELTACLGKADHHLDRKEAEEASRCLAEARQRLIQHRALVDERYTRWKEDKAKAEASIAATVDGLTALQPGKPLHP